MDCTEGMHKPLGRYILNNINFGKYDPLLPTLRSAGYRVWDNPADADGTLVTVPVKVDGVEFDIVNGLEVNIESAVEQLERYKMLMNNWCQQNVSATISYDPSEVPAIINWLLDNWDNYVGVSFLFRADPTKTAKDLGYLYLPQEVVSKEVYDDYVARLQPIDINKANDVDAVLMDDCASGACPIR